MVLGWIFFAFFRFVSFDISCNLLPILSLSLLSILWSGGAMFCLFWIDAIICVILLFLSCAMFLFAIDIVWPFLFLLMSSFSGSGLLFWGLFFCIVCCISCLFCWFRIVFSGWLYGFPFLCLIGDFFVFLLFLVSLMFSFCFLFLVVSVLLFVVAS